MTEAAQNAKKPYWIIMAVLAIVVVLLIVSVLSTYNSLVIKAESINLAWADVQSTYQRRADLIPNLVKTVKGYLDHESSTYINVVEARARFEPVLSKLEEDGKKIKDLTSTPNPTYSADTLHQLEELQSGINKGLGSLNLIVENYPNLKAAQLFVSLEDELAGTENRINQARRFYNAAVMTYNADLKTVPSNLIGLIFNFQEHAYFKAEDGEEKVPSIDFNKK